VPAPPSLAELQRWMRWALTHPLGAERALSGEGSDGLPDRFARPWPDAWPVIASGSGAGRRAVDRMAVYGDGYFTRLRGALELEYPRTAAALGAEGFRALVAAHLLRRPSTTPSLADLGEGLDETARSLPAAAERPWLGDLVSLERAAAEVWLSDAGGVGAWSGGPDEDWAGVCLGLGPAVRLLPVSWNVEDQEPDAAPERRPGWLVVWRVEASVGLERLEPGPGAVLDALARGTPLGAACELAGALGLSPAEVTAAFGDWAARGWNVRARPGGRDS